MLCEAAQSMLVRSTRWSRLKAWAMQIAKRRGKKKAIVASNCFIANVFNTGARTHAILQVDDGS